MKTNKFVGFLLILISFFSISLLIVSIFFDKRSDEKEIDNDSYKVNLKEIIKTDNSFIMFHSASENQNVLMEKNWQRVVKHFKKKSNQEVHVAKFDCSVFKPICDGVGIKNYPSFVWMENGLIVEHYNGKRDSKNMEKYIIQMVKEAKNRTKIKSASHLNNTAMTTTINTTTVSTMKLIVTNHSTNGRVKAPDKLIPANSSSLLPIKIAPTRSLKNIIGQSSNSSLKISLPIGLNSTKKISGYYSYKNQTVNSSSSEMKEFVDLSQELSEI